MTILISLLVSVNAYALNDVEKSFAENHKCYSEMNKRFHEDFFAKKSKSVRQVARTSNQKYSVYEYALWDKENKKISHVRYQDVKDDSDVFHVLQVDQPASAHDKYVLGHMAHPDARHAGDWNGCPVSFSPTKGIRNSDSVLYSNSTSYEDCWDKMGVKELKADPLNLDRATSNLLEQAIVDQLQSTDVKHFQSALAPNATMFQSTQRKQIIRYLPKLEKACGSVKSEKVRSAFAGYVNLVKKFYRIEQPRSKGKESKSGQQ